MSLLLNDLADPAEASAYLSAAWRESTQMFLTAVKDVLQARAQVASVARESGVAREHLYRTFTKDGNPTIATLRSVLHALGMDFPGIATLEEIAFSSASPVAAQKMNRRRAAKSRRIRTAQKVVQYSLLFDSAAAQSLSTGQLTLAARASTNEIITNVVSLTQMQSQNPQPPLPPAWMIEQLSASTQSVASKILPER
jgi:probable addiction module antidote protein